MIQDIGEDGLDNQYFNHKIEENDFVFLFDGRETLMKRTDTEILVPLYEELQGVINKSQCLYLFKLGGRKFFLAKKPWKRNEISLKGFTWENVRTLRQIETKRMCFACMTAYHLSVWYHSNRYCGQCGKLMKHDEKERMMKCPFCGNMVYPKIAPAVIVGLTNGNKILMTKYAGREYKKYALLAGFVEIGETAEQTVAREVMEEVGLHVKNIRYYKSQPWGVDSNLLLGYFAELDGSDEIKMDEQELAIAEWHDRDHLPAHDDGISLTREMIGVFEKGMEKF